jgi:hypothetical protein
MNPEFTVAILVFITFSIPIVGALWRLFSIREKLSTDIKELGFKLALLDHKLESLIDQQELALNGMKEIVSHIRTRTQTEDKKLSDRLTDVENWLSKNTEFNCRQRS